MGYEVLSMGQKKKSFLKKLTDQYRLIIIDEDTFEHKVDFSISRLNVVFVTGGFALLLIILTTWLIAATPLREYIPGYPSAEFKRKMLELNRKIDSLEKEAGIRQQYLDDLRRILTGEIKADTLAPEISVAPRETKVDTLALRPSEADLQLRKEVEEKEKFAAGTAYPAGDIHFIPPLRGHISQEFDLNKKHYGIDIVVKKKTPVKAVANGKVIFTGWTPDNGNVIIIQHGASWISVYKHNTKLLKKPGDLVHAGEVVAISGDTGTNSTGPHLHFELWKNGKPVDPAGYVDFRAELP